jgi:hypothetical protein
MGNYYLLTETKDNRIQETDLFYENGTKCHLYPFHLKHRFYKHSHHLSSSLYQLIQENLVYIKTWTYDIVAISTNGKHCLVRNPENIYQYDTTSLKVFKPLFAQNFEQWQIKKGEREILQQIDIENSYIVVKYAKNISQSRLVIFSNTSTQYFDCANTQRFVLLDTYRLFFASNGNFLIKNLTTNDTFPVMKKQDLSVRWNVITAYLNQWNIVIFYGQLHCDLYISIIELSNRHEQNLKFRQSALSVALPFESCILFSPFLNFSCHEPLTLRLNHKNHTKICLKKLKKKTDQKKIDGVYT